MSTEKKVPQRQCIGCGEMKNKRALLRVLKTTDGQITIDATGRKNGRGAYLCPSMDCFKKAVKGKGLERSFKMAIPKEVYESLEKEMGHATGREMRASLAVQDAGFSEAMKKQLCMNGGSECEG